MLFAEPVRAAVDNAEDDVRPSREPSTEDRCFRRSPLPKDEQRGEDGEYNEIYRAVCESH